MLRDGGTLAYAVAALVGAPYFLRRKRRLLQKGRSIYEFGLERWKIDFDNKSQNPPASPASDAAGTRVVVMGASWGELVTLSPLVAALKRERPVARLVLSVELGEAIATARALSDEAVLPWPYDSPLPVARWLARAQPDLVILYEQFDLPVITRALWLNRVPFIVIQTRVNAGREIGYKRRLNRPIFRRWQLRGLRAMLLQSPAHHQLLAPFAPDDAQLRVVGSLKFPHDRPQLAPSAEADLRAWIAAGTVSAPLLVAGSTHAGEEEFIVETLALVRRDCSGAAPVALLAPRRLGRVGEIVQLLDERGLRVSRRSQWHAGAPNEAVDVLLLDTLGELPLAYSHGVAAFVGGTFGDASHNVAEPLVWGIPVAYGPKRGNFEVEQTLCEAAGVGFRIETPAELAAHWTALLDSPALRRELSDKAEALVESQRAAFKRTLQILVEAVDEFAP